MADDDTSDRWSVPPLDRGMIEVVVEDKTFFEHSAILMAASPVFESMLACGMKETCSRRIELAGKSKGEFEVFLCFVHPGTARQQRIDVQNVDYLVAWFDEYGMNALKDECESFLMTLPSSVERLLQARRLSMRRQYARCLEEVGKNFETMNMKDVLEKAPELMPELMPFMQQGVKLRLGWRNEARFRFEAFCNGCICPCVSRPCKCPCTDRSR